MCGPLIVCLLPVRDNRLCQIKESRLDIEALLFLFMYSFFYFLLRGPATRDIVLSAS